MIGSANLSEQAFNKHSNQFETLYIIDNHPVYNLYLDYYKNTLSPILINYLPKELLDINVKRLKKYNKDEEQNIEEIIHLNNQEISTIKESSILETLNQTDEKIKLGVLEVNVKEEMRNINDTRQHEIKMQREERRQEDIAYSLIKESISPRAKEPTMKSTPSLKKLIKKRVTIQVSHDIDTGLPQRSMMINSPQERNSNKNITGLFIPSDLDEERLQPIGKKATTDELKLSLENLHRLIHSFEKYTVKYDDSYGARVMEAILYTFTSPFLFEIKSRARSEEERNDIPQFLFLGGTAGSGKSSLLKAIAKLTSQPYAVDYNSIVMTGSRRKKETVDTLNIWMNEMNVAPLLIDEIPEEFFTNKNYGNELIVNTSNRTAYDLRACPALIGTTNADGYTLEERARRRSYYLRLDKVFDEMYREESQPVYNQVYANLNAKLFNDFIVRLSDRLSNDSLDWANFGDTGKIDFLFHSREIFKEYYTETNIPLPRYFPITRYDDSKETNQEKWRKLFLGTSQEDFKFDEKSGNLLFKMAILDENISKFGGGKPSEIYKNALSPKVIVGSKDGTDIELDTPLFFEWIGIDNPFLKYYKTEIKKAYLERPDFFTENKRERSIQFDLKDIVGSDHPIIIRRYIEYISQENVIEKEKSILTIKTEDFYKWIELIPKKTLIEKIFSY